MAQRLTLWLTISHRDTTGTQYLTQWHNISQRDTIFCNIWQEITPCFFLTELGVCQEQYAKSLHFTKEILGDICIQTVASMIV